jgi:hypothetical protein
MRQRSSVRRTRRVPGADRGRQEGQLGLPSGLSLLRSRFLPSGTNLPAGLLASMQGAASPQPVQAPPAPAGIDPRKYPGGSPTFSERGPMLGALQSPYGGIQTTPAPLDEAMQGAPNAGPAVQPTPQIGTAWSAMNPSRPNQPLGPRGIMGTPQSSFDPRAALQRAGLSFF